MRFTTLLPIAFVGCTGTSSGAITVDPETAVLGLDLKHQFRVTQERCDTGYDGDGCTAVAPDHLAVELDSGTAIELGRIEPDAFELTGVAAGTSTVRLTGDEDVTRTFSVAVAAVDATTMFAQRKPPQGGLGLPDVPGPLQIFTETPIGIGQTSVAADHSALVGAAPLVLDKGATEVAVQPDCACYAIHCDCYTSGAIRGTATLSAPRGSLHLDVVDATAIAKFTLDDSSNISVEIGSGATPYQMFLTPSDAAGRPIIGRGPTPTMTIDDPTIATAAFDESVTVGRALIIRGLSTGTTALRLSWGSAQLELAVSVVP